MARETCGWHCHRRSFLVAATLSPVAWLTTGCDRDPDSCNECRGNGIKWMTCPTCDGRGALGGNECMNCRGLGKTPYICSSCNGSGKKPGREKRGRRSN
jgi:hypothetical protein